MLLFLGIDGGGTRTQAWLGDERGRVLARATAGPSNPTKVGLEAAEKELLRAAEKALRKISPAGLGKVRGRHPGPLLEAVCAGVAGAGRRVVSRPLAAWLRRAIPARHHLLVTDAALVLQAALGNRPGMIVIGGTGSGAFARNGRGETLRAGGWGAAFDDAGSGYDVGRRAIQAGLCEFDGRGEHTVLTARICKALKLTDISQIASKKFEIKRVAALSTLVSEAVREGDRVARRLSAQAGADLAQVALALARRLGRQAALPIVCHGGVFRSNPILRRSFARQVRRRLPSARVRLLLRPPVEGALALARNQVLPV
jgi:N-acetylglucosamine kinase-like BadF-type ATPase